MICKSYIGISPTLHIRGAFAKQAITKGEVIEECPLIIYSVKYDKHIDNTPLGNYPFVWTEIENCFLLGYGGLYNHSFDPNAYYLRDFDNKIMKFIALRDIKKDEEITHNYNGVPNSKKKIDKGHSNFDLEIKNSY